MASRKMENIIFVCPSCKKAYKKNGFWIKKHMIEVCRVKILKPLEFSSGLNLTFFKEFIHKEIQKALKVSNSNIWNSYKQLKSEKSQFGNLDKEKESFKFVVNELKGVFEIGISNYLKSVVN